MPLHMQVRGHARGNTHSGYNLRDEDLFVLSANLLAGKRPRDLDKPLEEQDFLLALVSLCGRK